MIHLFIISQSPLVMEEFGSHVFLCSLVTTKPRGGIELRHPIVRQFDVHPLDRMKSPNQDVAWFNVSMDYV